MLALIRLIELVKSHNLKAIIIVVDFKKPFDSIYRYIILRILKLYGISQNIIQAIALSYKYIYTKVIIPDGETDNFQISKGIFQDDILAPFLFVITLDYAMRQAIDGRKFGLEIK